MKTSLSAATICLTRISDGYPALSPSEVRVIFILRAARTLPCHVRLPATGFSQLPGSVSDMHAAGYRNVMTLKNIQSDFEFLDEWEDRYRYVIELGRALEPLSDEDRADTNKVQGCASQVWLATTLEPNSAGHGPRMSFTGDSDAHIVRGLIAILFAIYSGKTATEILNTDAHSVFQNLGLGEHLTPQRSNGFVSMVERIRTDARNALQTAQPVD